MATSKSGKDKATKKVAKKKAAPAPPASDELKFMVDSAWERRTTLTPEEMEGSTRPVVERVIERMEAGDLRVAEPDGKGGWIVNEWLKKAVLLYFRVQDMELVESYPSPFWDKIPLRFEEFDEAAFRKLGVRVVPGVIARRGSFIGKDVVLMPSFVNIGAYIGAGKIGRAHVCLLCWCPTARAGRSLTIGSRGPGCCTSACRTWGWWKAIRRRAGTRSRCASRSSTRPRSASSVCAWCRA